ncbi:MAG: hypothetical protein H6668_04425 [Ardenticatenaceae bacterium]|nr:hypothetical protein [Ardenticatenaceae bacterium]
MGSRARDWAVYAATFLLPPAYAGFTCPASQPGEANCPVLPDEPEGEGGLGKKAAVPQPT